MAFGLSGSDTTYQMGGSDVVVADYKENEMPRAVDYYLTGKAQVVTAVAIAAVIRFYQYIALGLLAVFC